MRYNSEAHIKKSNRNSRQQLIVILMPIILICFGLSMIGCDFSARWDLKRAEKALKEADRENAEFWAEREFQKAQKYLIEAMDYARDAKINEARDAASEARSWAQEATDLTIRRKAEMQKEHDGLDRKKY